VDSSKVLVNQTDASCGIASHFRENITQRAEAL